MVGLDFESVEEFEVVEVGVGSKYRATVLKFLEGGLVRARIVCGFVGEAKTVCRGLCLWIGVGEPVRVFARGRMVYLVRLSK